MRRAFKYRLYPTKAQAITLVAWLDVCRELYNAAIEERRDAWPRGVSVRLRDQSAQLPEIRRQRPDVVAVFSQTLQNVLRRVDFAFQAFFRRARAGKTPGYPRFKGRDRYDSLTWPQDIGFALVGTKRLRLGNFGEVRIKLHRPPEGRPKTCTVKREDGKWYAVLSCDEVPDRAYPTASGEIGLDMGLESFVTLSTGEKVANPRWHRKTEARLKDAQRALSKKKRGSKRRRKAKGRLARLHSKVREQRRDFHHKLAKRVVTENGFIAVEDLKPSEMVSDASDGVAKSIQDAAWAAFLMILSGKAEEAGRTLVRVPPAGTSSTCFRCGAYRKKGLSERVHSCPCGLVLDRDLHASLNILRLGRSLQVSTA